MNDQETQRRLAKLDALEAGGVDNWEFYSESLEEWFKENHVDECIADTIASINDLLVDAEVDEPAGRGAGHSITFNESEMYKILNKLITDSQEV